MLAEPEPDTAVASQDNPRRLHCLIEGESTIFLVTIESNCTVSELKEAIQRIRALGTLKHPHILQLWKIPINLNIQGNDRSLSQLKGDSRREGNKKLKSWKSILHYWPKQPFTEHFNKRLHIIVKIPPTANHRPKPAASAAYERYRNCFIRMEERWEFNQGILNLNMIDVIGPLEHYNIRSLDEFRQDLQKRRAVNSKFKDRLISALGIDYFKELYDLQKSDESVSCEFEMDHMNVICLMENDNYLAKYGKLTEVHSYFFRQFAHYCATYVSPSFVSSRGLLPYKLVVYRKDGYHHAPYLDTRYEPESDLFVILQGVPRIIMEVDEFDSNSQEDEKRMLAQGASLVRLVNKTLVENGYKADFILMAIYFEYTTIHRYLLCQKDESDESDEKDKKDKERVYCFEERFSNNRWDRARLLLQMYNLASRKEEDVDKFLKLKDELNTLSQQIESLPAYSSMKQPPKRTGGNDRNIFFEADGYELVNLNICMPGPKSRVFVVRRCKDRNQFIAKVSNPEEKEILEFLHTRESPSEYIIPLIGSFSSNMGPGILLPIRRPVLLLLAHPEKHRSRFLQFGEDLIKGLAFLHRHCIAHRNIKPDNLVYTDTFLLQIIDFDLATEVFDSDQLLEEDVGTDQYKAPETRDYYGNPNAHSPIMADRWSCGLVISRFLKCSDREGRLYEKMEDFARRLQDEDPCHRPSLCEWIELSSDKKSEVK